MQNPYIVTGAITDEYTITLDDALPLIPTKVRLIIEPLSDPLPNPAEPVDEEDSEEVTQNGMAQADTDLSHFEPMALASLTELWDNEEDAIYDNWKTLYEVEAG